MGAEKQELRVCETNVIVDLTPRRPLSVLGSSSGTCSNFSCFFYTYTDPTHPDQDESDIRVACILRNKCLRLLWAGMAVGTCVSYWPGPVQTLAAVPFT